VNDAEPKVNDLAASQIFWYHHPNGTSFKALKHWSQIIKHGEFLRFDYGKEKNLEIYGSEKPPTYNINSNSRKQIISSSHSPIPIAMM